MLAPFSVVIYERRPGFSDEWPVGGFKMYIYRVIKIMVILFYRFKGLSL